MDGIIPLKGGAMAEVRIDKKEDFEKALRKFNIQCKREGIIKEYRERQYYTKPSERKRSLKKKR